MGKIRKRGKKQHLIYMREKAVKMRERKNKYDISFIDDREHVVSETAAASNSALERDRDLENKITRSDVESHLLLHNLNNGSQSIAPEQIREESPLLFRDLDDGTVNCLTKYPESIPSDDEVLEDLHYDYQRFPDDDQKLNGSPDERRIIDIGYFFKQLQKVSSHSKAFGCGINNLELVGEKRTGLISKLKFKCNMCKIDLSVNTSEKSPSDNLNLNISVVTSAVTAGIGYTQLNEIFASMNIPFMTEPLYKKIDDHVSEEWEKLATVKMETAAARERQCALDEGRVNDDGIPIIDVIVDGCWAKRTYKKNYSSLSGAAAIIGRKFGEVLYLGVKNKYCCVCTRAENIKITPKEHKCFKNYTGSSTNMESEILVEGFKQSLDMYGVIYGKMVADGDASTYSKILEARPYHNYTVEKIECRNHLLRNMCNKLQALTKDTKYKMQDRKFLNTQRILAVRKAICLSIKHLKETNNTKAKQINELYLAISNSYNHAFSNHMSCQNFYCNSEKKSEDITVKLRNTPLETQIKFIVGSTAANARSLIEDVDSNRCEQFNSIIAKCIGGKRINFCLRRSYQTRCAAAVVSFNTKMPLYNLQKSMLGVSPKSKTKRLEMQKFKINRNKSNNVRRRKIFFGQKSKGVGDQNYGENCLKPDVPEEDLEMLKKTFLKNLERTDEERVKIEKETVLQSNCSKWMEMRRNLLTSSNFGQIINKRVTTSASIVKKILYKQDISAVNSIQHGKNNEIIALRQLEKQENIKITPCGLFIDKNIPFLGASPDGVIDENRIVEVKCPISGYRDTLEEAVKNKKVTFWKHINGQSIINQKHNWFFQVQGQLNITGRRECIFAVWTGSDRPIKVEIIQRNQKLWNEVMIPKLRKFYLESLLPELLDPRITRNMPIRDISAQPTKKIKPKNKVVNLDSPKIKKTKDIEFKDM